MSELELKYGKSERFIKSYTYCNSSLRGRGGEEVQKNLIVTNKRLIIESKGIYDLSRNEIPINFIDRIDSSWKKSRTRSFGWLWILIGLISVGAAFLYEMLILGASIFFLILGIIVLIRRKPYVFLELSFYSKNPIYSYGTITEYNFVEKNRKGMLIRKSRKDKRIIRKIIVKVTPVALEMINEIGALINDLKYYNMQQIKLDNLFENKIITESEYQVKKEGLLTNISSYK